MRFIFNIIIILVLFFVSCSIPDTGINNTNTTGLNDSSFNWIQGKYIVVHDLSGFYYEEWFKVDNDNYKGTGYFLSRDCVDTILSMKMRLMHEKGKTTLFYDVKDSTFTKETEFTLTKGENNVYVFENPFRSFPSIMQYKIIGDSVIEVTERGFEKNKEKVVEYKATKIN